MVVQGQWRNTDYDWLYKDNGGRNTDYDLLYKDNGGTQTMIGCTRTTEENRIYGHTKIIEEYRTTTGCTRNVKG